MSPSGTKQIAGNILLARKNFETTGSRLARPVCGRECLQNSWSRRMFPARVVGLSLLQLSYLKGSFFSWGILCESEDIRIRYWMTVTRLWASYPFRSGAIVLSTRNMPRAIFEWPLNTNARQPISRQSVCYSPMMWHSSFSTMITRTRQGHHPALYHRATRRLPATQSSSFRYR